MARIMKQSKPRQEGSTRVQFSEAIIFVAVLIALLAAGRYYFFVYRVSAGFALGEFMNAVNHGDVETQYEMLDEKDKQDYYKSKSDYEKNMVLSYGYSARINDLQISEVPHPDKPDQATVKVKISLRGKGTGKLTDNNAGSSVEDSYFLRKNSEGQWKVWLGKSARKLLTVAPNDKSNF